MQRYSGRTVVVKYGGHAMGDPELAATFARDIVLIKQSGVNPIVVHGGGPQIGAMLNKMGIESKFEGGLRVTDQKTVEIVEMVLAGSINKEIVALIKDGTVSGGMIPKVETCIEAIERGVEGVVILNGKTPHSVLLELFTEHGAGTLIVP
jgi:acetylglutamate kinase